MKVVNYKCPNCAAAMRFDIETQRWTCRFCNSDFDVADLERLEAQVGTEMPEADEAPAEEFQENDTAVYICPDCGGRIITALNTAATFCVYCHNPVVVAAHLQGEHKPVKIIPFKLPKERALAALREICRKKPLLPRGFRHAAKRGEITGLYVPFWLFSANISISVAGTARNVGSWTSGGYRNEKTDHFRILRQADIPFEMVPVDGSIRMDNNLMDALEPFDCSQMANFSMEYLSGFFAESYDEDATDCTLRFIERSDKGALQYMYETLRGYTSTSLETVDVRRRNMQSVYAMLPVWIMNVKDGKQVYTFAMNGQTGKIAGNLPVSSKRTLGWFGGFLLILIILTVLFGRFVL